MYFCKPVCTYVGMHVYVRVCTCMYMCMCMCVCICVCMCVLTLLCLSSQLLRDLGIRLVTNFQPLPYLSLQPLRSWSMRREVCQADIVCVVGMDLRLERTVVH